MRIAFLFDPARDANDCFNSISHEWLKGLVESGHQVKVITRKQAAMELPHPRLEWAETMNKWAWWETPKLLSVLIPYAPEVVHVALGQTPKRTSLWPTLSALKGLGIPLVVSTGDACLWPRQWRFYDQMLCPTYTNQWAVPWLLPKNQTEALEKQNNTVFVPGPLSAHKDWRQTLSELMIYMGKNPSKKYLLAWTWSEIPLAERLHWRERWQSHTREIDLSYLENLVPAEQLQMAQTSEVLLLDYLKQPSWWRSCFDAKILQADSAINQLARSYRSLSGKTRA